MRYDMTTGAASWHGDTRAPRAAPPVVHGFTSDPGKKRG